ncbi:HeH/LEM domain-containing protein [Facklamia hominis]|uniref:HeH/LEM domain-containing protein n=1 Tax=Facklamia hominis TaxID=178214 RepID=A0AAJ1Q7B5_9LACT|nr:HeH/LEM domain-containing protein [Facklamia hominis]
MTVAELKKQLDAKGITYSSGAKKAELIKLLA